MKTSTSIQNRIKLILAVSLGLLILMGMATLYYFSEISRDLELVIGTDIQLERSGQKLKRAFFDLKNVEKIYLYSLNKAPDSEVEESAEVLMKEVIRQYYASIEENLVHKKFSEDSRKRLVQLQENLQNYEREIDTVSGLQRDGAPFSVSQLKAQLESLSEDQDLMINDFLSFRYQQFQNHQKQIDILVNNAKRNIFLLISVGILMMALLLYLAPQKVVQPIRAYVNALRELQDLKFDVRLPVYQRNELAELGYEINAFIDSFLEFDTMKVKKIQFEKRKLQVLADILNLGVVVISIEGDVLFMNTQMASVLKLSSENFHKKDFHFVRLPDAMKELFEDAIAKKEKFENRMIILPVGKTDDSGEEIAESIELLVDAAVIRNYVGDIANVVFTFEDISNKPSESIFQRMSFYHKEKELQQKTS